MGNSYFFHKLVIGYGYWLNLLTISLENSGVCASQMNSDSYYFKNIVDIIVFFLLLGAKYNVTKSIGTSNVQILSFSLEIQQCIE